MDYKKILVDEFGMNPDATDEQVKAFIELLSPDNKQRIVAAGYDAGEPSAAPETAAASMAAGNFAALEMKRVGDIRSLASILPGITEDLINVSLAAQHTPQQASTAFLANVARQYKGIATVYVGDDNHRTALSAGLPDAIAIASGVRVRNPHQISQRFIGMSTLEIGRRWIESLGGNTAGLSRGTLAKALVNTRTLAAKFGSHVAELAATSGDFPHILANSYGKMLRAGYDETATTWPLWARRGIATDFKEQKRPLLSESPTPVAVLEGAEYVYANPVNTNEVFTLLKYGHIFSISWEALVNDDLGAFATMSRKFGAAAKRLEDDLAYGPLTSNQVMTEDSIALFHASHSNLTSSGTALSVASLGVGRAALAKAVGPGGAVLNIQARSLLVPVEILTTAEQLVSSLVDPSKGNDAVNPAFIRGLTVVGEPRLSASSAVAWYLASGDGDTVEVSFLEGNDAPFVEQQESFDTDATRFKLRHVCAARALDFRGLYKNNGA